MGPVSLSDLMRFKCYIKLLPQKFKIKLIRTYFSPNYTNLLVIALYRKLVSTSEPKSLFVGIFLNLRLDCISFRIRYECKLVSITSRIMKKRKAWNKGKIVGPKPALLPQHVQIIKSVLAEKKSLRNQLLFSLAIDSCLR